jgi:hypothetical protein
MIRSKLILTAMAVLALGACKKFKTDKELIASIDAIIANCDVDLRYGSLKNCKNNEKQSYDKLSKAKGPALVIPALAAKWAGADAKTSAAVAGLMYEAKNDFSAISKNPESIPDAAVDSLIDSLSKEKEYRAFYATQLITNLATLKKKEAALYKAVESHPEVAIQTEAFGNLMKYGRLRVFDKIKQLAESAPEKYVRSAALHAPQNMYKYTDEETNAVCPWAKGYLENAESSVASNAAKVLVLRCKGPYIDAVLDKAEALQKENKLKGSPYVGALTNFTFSCGTFLGSGPTGTEAQCKRKEALAAALKK